jgi:transposase
MTEERITLATKVGIDWADTEHEVCMQVGGSSSTVSCTLKQTPESLARWATELKERFGGGLVGVCLEQSRGPLIYALSQYPWLVLYPVNPKSLASHRATFRPSGAKDDRSDAELLCDLLCKHQEQLRPWKAQDPQTRKLRLLLENRDKLVDDRTRLVSRLRATLKSYYPQALQWAGELTKPLAWHFLLKWPRLNVLRRVRKHQLLKFYHAHHVRRGQLLDGAFEQIRQAVPLITDPAIVESSALIVQTLCKQLLSLQTGIDEHDHEIEALYAAHPDKDLFGSFPGAGPVMGPRLVAAFGTDRKRFTDATQLQRLGGIAPVTERSGRHVWVHWRWAAPSFLRQSFHEFALHSRGYSLWARLCYEYLRSKGKDHHTAIRILAFKWIRILYRCWRTRTPYDETRYIQCLRHRGPPLANLIDQYLASQETV